MSLEPAIAALVGFVGLGENPHLAHGDRHWIDRSSRCRSVPRASLRGLALRQPSLWPGIGLSLENNASMCGFSRERIQQNGLQPEGLI